MMNLRRTALLLFALTTASELLAHDGHGQTEGGSLLHYVSEPFHTTALLLIVATIVACLLMVQRRRVARQVASKRATRA